MKTPSRILRVGVELTWQHIMDNGGCSAYGRTYVLGIPWRH